MSYQEEMQARVNESFNRAMDDWENRMPADEEEDDEYVIACPFCGSIDWTTMYETENGTMLGCSDCVKDTYDPEYHGETQEYVDGFSLDSTVYHHLREYLNKDVELDPLVRTFVENILFDFVKDHR